MIESSGTTTATSPTRSMWRLKNARSFDIREPPDLYETFRHVRYNTTRPHVSGARAAFTGRLQLFTCLYRSVMTFTRRESKVTDRNHPRGRRLFGWSENVMKTKRWQRIAF